MTPPYMRTTCSLGSVFIQRTCGSHEAIRRRLEDGRARVHHLVAGPGNETTRLHLAAILRSVPLEFNLLREALDGRGHGPEAVRRARAGTAAIFPGAAVPRRLRHLCLTGGRGAHLASVRTEIPLEARLAVVEIVVVRVNDGTLAAFGLKELRAILIQRTSSCHEPIRGRLEDGRARVHHLVAGPGDEATRLHLAAILGS